MKPTALSSLPNNPTPCRPIQTKFTRKKLNWRGQPDQIAKIWKVIYGIRNENAGHRLNVQPASKKFGGGYSSNVIRSFGS